MCVSVSPILSRLFLLLRVYAAFFERRCLFDKVNPPSEWSNVEMLPLLLDGFGPIR